VSRVVVTAHFPSDVIASDEQLRADLEYSPESLTEWLHKYGGRRMYVEAASQS
jgi:hypothetical protein